MPFDKYKVELFTELQQQEYQRLQRELHLELEEPNNAVPIQPMFQFMLEHEQQQQLLQQQHQEYQQLEQEYQQRIQQEYQRHQQLPGLQ